MHRPVDPRLLEHEHEPSVPLRVFFIVIVIIGAVPFLLYARGLAIHSLPSYNFWANSGNVHGPWFNVEPYETIIRAGWMLLGGISPFIFFHGLFESALRNDKVILFKAGLLTVIALGLACAQYFLITWTIT